MDSSESVGLEENLVRRWCAEMVDAVGWLHGCGWAHRFVTTAFSRVSRHESDLNVHSQRDIKPHNILLDEKGRILLTDFGSAASITSLPIPGSIARKDCRTLVGTPDYIAPEVLLFAERLVEDSFDLDSSEQRDDEERAYGIEVDWWSLGVTVYEVSSRSSPECFSFRFVGSCKHMLKYNPCFVKIFLLALVRSSALLCGEYCGDLCSDQERFCG